jgi:hypothetical protein
MILTKTSKYNYRNLKTDKEYILDNKNLYETPPKILLALITFDNKIQLSIDLPNVERLISNNKMQKNNNYKDVNYEYNIKINTDKVNNALHLLKTIKIDNLFEIFDKPKNSLMELIDELEI